MQWFTPIWGQSSAGDLWFPPQGSDVAPSIDWAFYVVLWISVVLFVPIVGVMLYFATKYRRKTKDQDPLPSPSHNQALEVTWSILPIFIVFAIFYVGVEGFLNMRVMPNNALEIGVIAKQWTWLFEYPNGAKEPDLHVPIHTNVVLKMPDV